LFDVLLIVVPADSLDMSVIEITVSVLCHN